MKKLILILLILIMSVPVFGQQFRIQTAGSMFAMTGEKPIFMAQFGLSRELTNEKSHGGMYAVALGKFGDNAKGANLELVYFPIRPTGSGWRMFFVIGGNLTEVEFIQMEPVAYLQFTSGMGAYWDFTQTSAGWLACKLESAQDINSIQVAVGLSTAF